MKKIILSLTIALSAYGAYAQSPLYTTGGYGANYNTNGAYLGWNISGAGGETNFVNNIGGGTAGGFTFDNVTLTNVTTRLMTVLGNGNVGIGTTSPGHKLEVNGNSYFASDIDINGISSSTNSIGLNVSGGTPQLYLRGSTASNTIGGSASLFFMDNTNVNDWALQADGSYNFGFWRYAGGWNKIAYITPTGGAFFGDNVSIGTTDPQGYKLAVKGTIHTQEVKVDMTGWNDYVFDKTYPLKSLSSLKSYIDENHHLPEIPSEAEVIKNGVNVGEMLKLQTKKIEELTLYAIQLKEENQQLKADEQKKNDAQEARIAALEKSLLKLAEDQIK